MEKKRHITFVIPEDLILKIEEEKIKSLRYKSAIVELALRKYFESDNI